MTCCCEWLSVIVPLHPPLTALAASRLPSYLLVKPGEPGLEGMSLGCNAHSPPATLAFSCCYAKLHVVVFLRKAGEAWGADIWAVACAVDPNAILAQQGEVQLNPDGSVGCPPSQYAFTTLMHRRRSPCSLLCNAALQMLTVNDYAGCFRRTEDVMLSNWCVEATPIGTAV